MLPIPKNLLIHEVIYYEKKDDGRYDGGYDDPVTITNVLVNTSSSMNHGNSKGKKHKSTMIIDLYNSSPALKPTTQSKILFNGTELFVNNVKEVNDVFKLHHYEVELT